jgi:hypothetical protein
VRRLFDESDIGTANKAVKKIITDIKKTSDAIRIKYSVETRQGTPVREFVKNKLPSQRINNDIPFRQ